MSLSDQAYDFIRHDILTCVLLPGQQIIQAQLVEKYQLGTTPVREALQKLSHEGLVITVPRTGYIVSPITLAEVRELFEFRSILETAAVRIAVQRASDEQLAKIAEQANFTYTYSDRGDYPRFVALNHAFHCAIAAASGNHRLEEALSRTLDSLTRVFHVILDVHDSAEETRKEHLVLVEALQARDAEKAVAAVNMQINRTAQLVGEAVARNIASSAGGPAIFDPGQIIMVSNGGSEH